MLGELMTRSNSAWNNSGVWPRLASVYGKVEFGSSVPMIVTASVPSPQYSKSTSYIDVCFSVGGKRLRVNLSTKEQLYEFMKNLAEVADYICREEKLKEIENGLTEANTIWDKEKPINNLS